MATIFLFLDWYYTEIPKKAFRIWRNYIWFWGYYFSLKDLLKTFFSPWKKYSEAHGKGVDFGRMISAFLFNIFSRFMGAFLRSFLILAGLIIELITIIFGALFFIIWPIFPLFLLVVLGIGFIYA